MSARKPWPKDGLYVSELIDTLVDYYEKPDSSLTSSSEWKENMKSKLLRSKQVAAAANVVTIDDLIEHLENK